MCEHNDDERLAALAERAERGELPVPPGARIQRASDEGPAGAAELLEMTGASTLDEALGVLLEAAKRAEKP